SSASPSAHNRTPAATSRQTYGWGWVRIEECTPSGEPLVLLEVPEGKHPVAATVNMSFKKQPASAGP
ncbi:MAG: hypothetical protein ACRD10_00010, partial [Terriglobia bacterium]